MDALELVVDIEELLSCLTNVLRNDPRIAACDPVLVADVLRRASGLRSRLKLLLDSPAKVRLVTAIPIRMRWILDPHRLVVLTTDGDLMLRTETPSGESLRLLQAGARPRDGDNYVRSLGLTPRRVLSLGDHNDDGVVPDQKSRKRLANPKPRRGGVRG